MNQKRDNDIKIIKYFFFVCGQSWFRYSSLFMGRQKTILQTTQSTLGHLLKCEMICLAREHSRNSQETPAVQSFTWLNTRRFCAQRFHEHWKGKKMSGWLWWWCTNDFWWLFFLQQKCSSIIKDHRLWQSVYFWQPTLPSKWTAKNAL